jgi:hypothetical protein
MSVRKVFKAHQKDVTSLCWHPETDSLLASGGYDSAIHFWDTQGTAEPIKSIQGAHEGPIWSLAWHPLGHLLVSGSHDYSTRFWSRARPGDKNFEECLPKKIAAPGDLPAKSIPPPPSIANSVLDSGIFASRPPKEPPAACVIMQGAKEPARLALDNEPAKVASGLSLGEGADRKEILDTSDFDALEDRPVQQAAVAASTESSTPKVDTQVEKAFSKAASPATANSSPSTVSAEADKKPTSPQTSTTAGETKTETDKAVPASEEGKEGLAKEGVATEKEASTESPEVGGEKRAAPEVESGESTESDAKKARTEENQNEEKGTEAASEKKDTEVKDAVDKEAGA